MAWYDNVDASLKWRLGSRKRDVDGREYVYCKGVSSLAANEWVSIDEDYALGRLTTSSNYGPVGIAQAAADATTEYCWVGIYGEFTGKCVDGGGNDDNELVYATATAGQVTAAADNDEQVIGAVYRSNDNSTALTATFQINYPFFTHDLST